MSEQYNIETFNRMKSSMKTLEKLMEQDLLDEGFDDSVMPKCTGKIQMGEETERVWYEVLLENNILGWATFGEVRGVFGQTIVVLEEEDVV